MRYPVSVKPFRGQLDVAAFAGVFLLLVVFLLLTRLVYTPGVRLQLPAATDLPGTDRPTVEVAVDSSGRYYFQTRKSPGQCCGNVCSSRRRGPNPSRWWCRPMPRSATRC